MRILEFIDRTSMVLSLLSGAAIGCVAIMIALEIVLRNIFAISLHFIWEYSVFIHLSAVFLGAGWTLRTGGHIRVTILKAALPRAAEWVGTIGGLIMSIFLSNALVQLAWTYFTSGRTSGSSTNTPLAYPAAIVAFGALVLTLQIALRALRLALDKPVELTEKGRSLSVPMAD